MSELPIVHMTLYKHGVGYFRRRGPVNGESITLTVRHQDMDDLLKSLTVIDYGQGRIQGVDYDTPQSQAERLAGCSVILDDTHSLSDLLTALRGRLVQLLIKDSGFEYGTLLGLDIDKEKPLEQSLVSLLREESEMVVVFALKQIEGVELRDESAAEDLRFFLKTAAGQETHRAITVRLSPGQHDLEVSYIAPAPTWRVSYRLVMESLEDQELPRALLQGWGIFDNQLEEDLADISLSLTAGMPISFVYDLYTPHTPQRPHITPEERVAAGPILFDGAVQAEAAPGAPPSPAPLMAAQARMPAAQRAAFAGKMADSVESAATGQPLGELFQYKVTTPVTVGRGQSAMVPIVITELKVKKELIYNGAKMPIHPVATVRFENSSELTLEQGPVTVLEDSEYVGEAVLPFTANKAEAVISYAVELGVHIKESVQREYQLHTLDLKGGYLIHNAFDIQRTHYKIDNRTEAAKTILIEHPVDPNYTTFDTPAPAEKTLETERYTTKAIPGKITEFTVHKRLLRTRQEALSNLSYQDLQRYFADKLLDETTYESLKDLLDQLAEIEKLQQIIGQQEQQRQKIYQAQEQAQKNMGVLSDQGEEGQLRSRYVQQLTQSEEQLADIAQTISEAEAAIAQKQETVAQMMADLGAEVGQ